VRPKDIGCGLHAAGGSQATATGPMPKIILLRFVRNEALAG
jgi:hypothetical protein